MFTESTYEPIRVNWNRLWNNRLWNNRYFLEQKTERVDEEQHEMRNEKHLLKDENRLILIIWIEKNLLKKPKKFIAGKF